ncbi:hypothetical protein SAMN05660477_03174 [Soonwooa buanensis]|uniref:Uncharacterized protein n=1 Tax=Soonwooa buanensis TaxID=619805 RepID=A0A1T5GWE3_9FLAO|nr:hypothetical protein [Soonwooa buanensis]SKC12744.1 hypothetical protein SAMN05660477_03174 [Soonwooa buanensis]
MNKKLQILVIAVLAIVILKIFNGLIILNIGTSKIETNAYPKFLFYLLGLLYISIFFMSNLKIYNYIKNQKHKYWKLSAFTLLIGICSYLLFFLIQLITFKYFPNYDPNAITSKNLGIPYIEPKFNPINELLINPIIQFYYYIPGIQFFPLDVVMYFFGQPLFLSFVFPLVVILLRNKKNYR